MIKSNPNIKGLLTYCVRRWHNTFLNDQKSIKELMKTFKLFSKFSGLKPNMLKCQVSGIGSVKGVKMAVFGTKCIDLTTETIKILSVCTFLLIKSFANTKTFREKHH